MAINLLMTNVMLAVLMQSSTGIDQVAPPSRSGVSVMQSAPMTQKHADKVDTNIQVNKGEKTPPPLPQLTLSKSDGKVDQLGKRDRNTQSAPDVADRRQGYETRIIKLEGTDKCSADLLSERDRAFCQKIMETRPGDYAGPTAPSLSSDQELLSQRNSRSLEGRTNAAIGRLATGQASSNDSEEQAIASVVLSGQGAPTQPTNEPAVEAGLSAETQALVDAIVRNVGGGPRN